MNLLDERVFSVDVIESNQLLIPLPENQEKILLDHEVDLGYANKFLAREEVVKRLYRAAQLLPEGIFLSIKETFRPLEFQSFIFSRRANRLSQLPEHSSKSTVEIRELTSQFIAPPEVAGHPTGGAVDVSLTDLDGRELDLGCGYDEDEVASHGRCFSFAEDISEQAKQNRAILFNCLNKAGFVNYPFEWWHWSYGDKY